MRGNTGWVRRGGAVVAAVAVVGAVAACGADGAPTKGDGNGGQVKTPDTFTSNVAGAMAKCAKVKVALGEPKRAEGDGDRMKLPLTMTNSSREACLLRGYPGARLQGQDSQAWDLVRAGDEVKDVKDVPLEPDGTTTAYLTYLPEKGDNRWDVVTLVVTPPNTDDSQTFKWPGGSVLRQDASTHPGTYIGPVGTWDSGGA
ncbi:DUF4232 domain-containing protein [Umezawaea endophytica]|uniref:DUF4232 domain-containing protein n=1 Tax=Umezawaea endophytica TaxID=1654476 RepID=A0A9X2VVS6_9PSEU|nr:DUF4232 domain-containing protein [Umezawaea endophytica]MCS7483097.1 DUF4232 domain-containing protein [Umezawaea endophytica]